MMQIPSFRLSYPDLSKQRFRTSIPRYTAEEKVIVMLVITIFGAIVLFGLSAFFAIYLINYMANHRTGSLITFFLEIVIYITLALNMMYALFIYFISNMERKAYNEAKHFILYFSIANLCLHLIVIVISIIYASTNTHYKGLLTLVILPIGVEMIIAGLCTLSTYNLFKKVTKFIPIMQIVNLV